MLSAEDWYEAFYGAYPQFPAIDRVLRGRKVSDSEWTRIMKNEFLPSLAKQLGYTVAQETVRVDQLWNKKENVEVAIEHENDFTTIDTELGNLSTIDAPLKVLITYVGNRELTWRPYELAERVRQHLDRRQKPGEFLLLVTDERGKEWSAFKYAPRLVAQMSVLPPPTPGRKAARTRRRAVDVN